MAWRCPAGDEPAPLVLWIHGGPLASWNCLALAVESVAARRAGICGIAAGSRRCRPVTVRTSSSAAGAHGVARRTPTSWRPPTRHARIPASTRRAPRRWAGRSAATWPTGSPGTPTGSTRSSPTPACGRSTSSGRPPTARTGGLREMTPEMADANSPHRFVGQIRTPMLVIHGDKDYRVPIGEALRLWYELLTESGLPAADGRHQPAPVPLLPVGEPLGAHSAARQDLVPGRDRPSWPVTCWVRTSNCPRRSGSVGRP